jgi:hypothetical protein
MKRVAGAAMALILAAAPLAAQQTGMARMHDRRPMAGQRNGQGAGMMATGMAWDDAMMGDLPPSPAMLIRAQEALGLTEDQVARLGALQEEAQAEAQAHMEAARQSRQQAMQDLSGTPDLDAYRQDLQTAHTEMLEAHMAVVRSRVEAGAVLTEAQQKKLDTAREVMRAMRQGGETAEPGHLE